MKFIFSLLLLIGFAQSWAMDSLESLDLSKRIYMPDRLEDVRMVKFNNGHFKVQKDGHAFEDVVQKAFIDKQIRDFDQKKLIKYLNHDNYLYLDQMSDGQYTIKGKSRVRGGGPVAACVGYWATKTICYTLGLVGVGAGVAATGGALGAAGGVLVGAAGASAGGAGIAAGAIGAGMTAAAASGSTVAAGTMVVGAALAEGTAAVVTSAGGVAATMAAVETLSVAISSALMALPIP